MVTKKQIGEFFLSWINNKKDNTEIGKKNNISVFLQEYSSRYVFVRYNRIGTILSVSSIVKKNIEGNGKIYTYPDKICGAEMKVPLKLEKENILEIHNQCIVVMVDGKPFLAKRN